MPDPTLPEVMEAIAAVLRSALAGTADPLIDDLNVYQLLTYNPTPPAIDIYPASPFYEQISYGLPNSEIAFVVRARVNGDHQEQQRTLIKMMDPRDPTSVAAALHRNTLNDTVSRVDVEPPSDYQIFLDPGGDGVGLLGCTWRTRVIL